MIFEERKQKDQKMRVRKDKFLSLFYCIFEFLI